MRSITSIFVIFVFLQVLIANAMAQIRQNADGSFTDTWVENGIRYERTFKDLDALNEHNARELEFQERMKEIRDLANEPPSKK